MVRLGIPEGATKEMQSVPSRLSDLNIVASCLWPAVCGQPSLMVRYGTGTVEGNTTPSTTLMT